MFLLKNYHPIRQNDYTDCGPACLVSIARYYGQRTTITRIRQLAGTDRQGTNILGLIRAAEALGFTAKGVRCGPNAILSVPLPAIAHVLFNPNCPHFVVVYSIRKNRVTVMDPARGIVQYPIDDFKRAWIGILVLIQFDSRTNCASKDSSSSFLKFWSLITAERRSLVDSFIAAFMFTILSVCTAFYLQLILDEVLPDGNRNLLTMLGFGMIVIIVFRLVFNAFRQLLIIRIVQKLDTRLVLGYYHHLLALPQSFFDTRFIGEIVSRVNDAVKVRFALSNAVVTILVDVLVITAALIAMAMYPFRLSMVSYGLFMVCVALALGMARPVRRTQLAMMRQGAEFQSHLVTTVQGISTIRCFSAVASNRFKAESLFGSMLDLVSKSYKQQLFVQSVGDTASSLAVVGILWTGGVYAIGSDISIGELMSVYVLFGYLTGPISRMIGMQYIIQDAWAASERLFEIMDLETEDDLHMGTVCIDRNKIMGNVVFEDCHFRYGTRKKVLSGLSMSIPGGKITMIFGENGSGKSTLFNLMLKQYEPEAGKILIDGMDLRMIETLSLRSLVSVVPQQAVLFPMTVFENIAYGDMNPDTEHVISVAKAVGLDKTIDSLPQQYQTLLGENGAILSGGQRQMLIVARALYRKPRILLLDEPAASMDSESEARLYALLRQMRDQNVTVVMITHSWKVVPHADNVFVLKDGITAKEGVMEEMVRREI